MTKDLALLISPDQPYYHPAILVQTGREPAKAMG